MEEKIISLHREGFSKTQTKTTVTTRMEKNNKANVSTIAFQLESQWIKRKSMSLLDLENRKLWGSSFQEANILKKNRRT